MNSVSNSNELQQMLDELVAVNADKFDPVRFFYISKLAEKLSKASEAVAFILQQKAMEAVQRYHEDFNNTKTKTLESVERITNQYPEMVERCQSLLEQNDFSGIKKLSHQLIIEKRMAGIKRLAAVFEQPLDNDDPSQHQLSFDEFLLNQENEAIQSFTDEAPNSELETNNQLSELKAHKLFKDSWVKMHSDKLVTQAIQDAPKDAGPLNSHMLAIRSIQAMKELSPEYLNRFVSYMDSLLWLEKSMEQQNSSGKKAKGRAKSKINK